VGIASPLFPTTSRVIRHLRDRRISATRARLSIWPVRPELLVGGEVVIETVLYLGRGLPNLDPEQLLDRLGSTWRCRTNDRPPLGTVAVTDFQPTRRASRCGRDRAAGRQVLTTWAFLAIVGKRTRRPPRSVAGDAVVELA